MSGECNASRDLRTLKKSVKLSPSEWLLVSERMSLARTPRFSTYARGMLLDGEINIDYRRVDVDQVRHLIAPLGNNLNQIARHTNIEDITSHEHMYAALKILERCERILERHMSEGTSGGSC